MNLSVIAVDLQTFCCDFEKYKLDFYISRLDND